MYRQILLFIALLLGAFGCDSKQGKSAHESIIGTWKSALKKSEWGQVVTILTFTENGSFKMENDFVGESKPLVIQGTYSSTDGKMSSDLFKDKQYVDFWFEGRDLVLKEDVGPVHYTRTK